MSSLFANPLLAWFALLGSIPVIIHLLNRRQYKTRDWAAMKFLKKALKKTRKKTRIEELLLLLLRVLLFVLLAFALAQPVLEQTPLSLTDQDQNHFILVLDTSYSMQKKSPRNNRRGKPILNQAKKQATTFLKNNFHPEQGDRVSILTSKSNPEELIGIPSSDKERALQLISDLDPSYHTGDLRNTIDQIRKIRQKRPKNVNAKILWFTDLQKIDWAPSPDFERNQLKKKLADLTHNDRSVILIDVGSKADQNLSIKNFEPKNEYIVTDRNVQFSATIKNHALTRQQGKITLLMNDQKKDSIQFSVDPGSEIQKEFKNVRFQSTDPHRVKVSLTPDVLSVDNERYLSVQPKNAIRILGIQNQSEETEQQELFPVEKALAPTGYQSPYEFKTIPHYLFRDTDLKPYDLLIFGNVPSFSDKIKELESFVEKGGGVLFFAGDRVVLENYNEKLHTDEPPFLPGKLVEKASAAAASQPPVDPSGETNGSNRSSENNELRQLASIDFNHPALQLFQSHKKLLRSLPARSWIKVAPPENQSDSVRVLARYENTGDPAILERFYGKGKVMMITTTANDQWNFWMGFQGYVALLDQLTQYLISHDLHSRNLSIGSPHQYEVNPTDHQNQFRVETPSGNVSSRSPRPVEPWGYALFLDPLIEPGFFRLEQKENKKWMLQDYLAANIHSEEGDLKRTSFQELRELYPNFSFERFKTSDTGKNPSEIQRQESNLWMFLAITVLVLLILESLFSLFIDRRRSVS